MDTAYSTEDLAFRDEVRGFFDEAYTSELQARLRSPDYKNAIEEWQRKLYEKGWIAPNWNMAARVGRQRKNIFTRRSDPLPASRTWCLLVW